jgi:hypothetical protein
MYAVNRGARRGGGGRQCARVGVPETRRNPTGDEHDDLRRVHPRERVKYVFDRAQGRIVAKRVGLGHLPGFVPDLIGAHRGLSAHPRPATGRALSLDHAAEREGVPLTDVVGFGHADMVELGWLRPALPGDVIECLADPSRDRA